MLVGRQRELARVETVVAAARGGGSSALLVVGPAGLGKSSLLQHAVGVAGDDVVLLRTRGIESGEHEPFAGLEKLLGPILGLRAELPQAQAAALNQALALEAGTPAARFAVGAAAVTLLGLAAEAHPVLCVVDDLQWLDEPSLEAVLFVARRLHADGVGLLLASRVDTPVAARAAAGVQRLELEPLDDAAALELLRAQHPGGVAQDVAVRLVATAAGNPLALSEMAGLLSDDERTGRMPVATPLPVGATLERTLADRLAALPRDTLRALAIAAAGESRRGDIVIAALRHDGLDLPALEPAETAAIVQVQSGEIVFRHPLLRAAAYHAVSDDERRAAHAAVAAVLDPSDPQRAWQRAATVTEPDEEIAAELEAAGHSALVRGGLAPAASAQLRAAQLSPQPADRARRLLGAAIALLAAGQLDRAADLLADASRIEGADALAPALRTARGHVALRRGRSSEARALLEPEAAASEQSDPSAAAALWLLASLAATTGRDADAALQAAERARAIAGDDPTLQTLATALSGTAHLAAGHPEEGTELLVRAEPGLADMDPIGPAAELVTIAAHAFVWIDDHVRAERTLGRIVDRARKASAVGALPYPLAALAQLELSRGRWRAAKAAAEEAVALGEQAGQEAALVIALSTRAWSAANRGDERTARSDAERAFALAGASGTLALTLYARHGLGLLALAQRRLDDAIAQLEHARAEALPGHLTWAPELAEALIGAGRDSDADTLLARVVRPAAGLPPALVARCRALRADADGVDDAFAAAIALHESAPPAPFELARTRLLYGERLAALERLKDARLPLREALATFEELEAAPWADRARVQLAEAGGARPRAAGPLTAVLTAHELQVALLVAEGRTNKEAAAALFLSPKTVEHHLGAIYRKLAIRRRAELTRLLADELPAPAPA